jgi:hypothetical protein
MFAKISLQKLTLLAESLIIIDVEYLGNGASDWILFTKEGISEISAIFVNFR